jgi:NADH-ubiquinone oxidoreductase chain 5
MVVAGVYLLLRLSPLFEYSATALLLIIWVGALTGLIAATIGLCQSDLKRVIAYSTTSQLGMMFLACGLSQYNVALFHLVNHAFFKALLFLSAGAIIHAMNDEQDLRKYGGLIQILPLTYICVLIGSLSLMAMPFLTGFYSKELIIISAYGHYSISGYVTYFLCVLTSMFTSLYSARLIYLTFLCAPNGPKVNYLSAHESPLPMAIPMFLLAFLSIFGGYLVRDFFVPGSQYPLGFSRALFVHPVHALEPEFSVPLLSKLLPLLLSLLAPGLLIALYILRPSALQVVHSNLRLSVFTFLARAMFFPALFSRLTQFFLSVGYITAKTLDKGVLEILGPYGIANILSNASSRIARLDTGFIPHYAFYVIVGLIFFIWFSLGFVDPKYLFILLGALFLFPNYHVSSSKTVSPSNILII